MMEFMNPLGSLESAASPGAGLSPFVDMVVGCGESSLLIINEMQIIEICGTDF